MVPPEGSWTTLSLHASICNTTAFGLNSDPQPHRHLVLTLFTAFQVVTEEASAFLERRKEERTGVGTGRKDPLPHSGCRKVPQTRTCLRAAGPSPAARPRGHSGFVSGNHSLTRETYCRVSVTVKCPHLETAPGRTVVPSSGRMEEPHSVPHTPSPLRMRPESTPTPQ